MARRGFRVRSPAARRCQILGARSVAHKSALQRDERGRACGNPGPARSHRGLCARGSRERTIFILSQWDRARTRRPSVQGCGRWRSRSMRWCRGARQRHAAARAARGQRSSSLRRLAKNPGPGDARAGEVGAHLHVALEGLRQQLQQRHAGMLGGARIEDAPPSAGRRRGSAGSGCDDAGEFAAAGSRRGPWVSSRRPGGYGRQERVARSCGGAPPTPVAARQPTLPSRRPRCGKATGRGARTGRANRPCERNRQPPRRPALAQRVAALLGPRFLASSSDAR
jgi:hypothetical protein